MFLGIALFSHLAAQCISAEAKAQVGWTDHLQAIARVESRLNPFAIHDNATGKTFLPKDQDAAVQLADKLIAEHHQVDLGLMQIDSANFTNLGLSIKSAFDSCRSIAAGSDLLMDGYRHAMRAAYSEYNTGSPTRGLAYAAKVEAASGELPLRNASPETTAESDPPQQSCAPAWDVWAAATCRAPETPVGVPSPNGVASVSLRASGVTE